MHYSSVGSSKQEIANICVRRQDGSVSQLIIQDNEGVVHALGYFAPGTAEPYWDALKYHWSDSFTDEELRLHFPEEGPVEALREESRVSNETQTFTHRSVKQ